MRYGSFLNRYKNEPLFKHLFKDGVKTWYPILKKNYGIMFHHSFYAEEILRLTFSGACPQNYLENHMNQPAGLNADSLKKDKAFMAQLKELDPSGENRKTLLHCYIYEDTRRKYR